MDCPQTLEEALTILEDDIEDWIFVANDDDADSGQNNDNPY